jgi:hypothetical protein
VDIFFIIDPAYLRQGMAFQSLFYLDLAILVRRTPLPMRRSFPEGVTQNTKGKLSSREAKKLLGFMLRKAIRHHELITSKMTG